MTSCPNCDALLPYGAVACPSCGTVVGTVAPLSAPLASGTTPTVGAMTLQGGRAKGGLGLPNQPSLPLFPGETVLARFNSNPAGMSKVLAFNALIVVGVFLAILLPLILFALLAIGSFDPVLLVAFFPVVLILLILGISARAAGRRAPTVVFVTDRRVIVDSLGRPANSAAIGLESLGDVQIDQSVRAARRVGIGWVYLLPMGTTTALVGRGRYRRAAPGVVWISAMPMDQAESLRSLVVAQARDLQARLGYPNPTRPT